MAEVPAASSHSKAGQPYFRGKSCPRTSSARGMEIAKCFLPLFHTGSMDTRSNVSQSGHGQEGEISPWCKPLSDTKGLLLPNKREEVGEAQWSRAPWTSPKGSFLLPSHKMSGLSMLQLVCFGGSNSSALFLCCPFHLPYLSGSPPATASLFPICNEEQW